MDYWWIPVAFLSCVLFLLLVLALVVGKWGKKKKPSSTEEGTGQHVNHVPAAPAARAHGGHVESHGHGHGGNGWAGPTIFLVVVALIVAAGLYTWKDGWWRGPEIHPGVATSAAENYDTDPSHYCMTKPRKSDVVTHSKSPDKVITITVPPYFSLCPNLREVSGVKDLSCVNHVCSFKTTTEVETWLEPVPRQ